MDCLRDWIGLRGCGVTTTPVSGYYINDLAGVSLRMLTGLTTEETATFLEMWNLIQTRAESRFSVDVRDQFTKRYRINTTNQMVTIGKEVTGSGTASTGGFKGFTIELTTDLTDSTLVPSPLTYISLQSLNYYCHSADNAKQREVAVFDLLTGVKLWTTTVTLATGWNTINVGQKLTAGYHRVPMRVFCGINTQDLTTYDLERPAYSTIAGCCGAGIQGASTSETSSITFSDLTRADNTYGMSGVFSINCGWEGLVCNNKEPFTRAYWFCLGYELLTELLYSAKINSYTTIDRAKAKELREEYLGEYTRALNIVCDNISLDCDCCIECGDTLKVVTTNGFY